MMNITPEQALATLYQAADQVSANGEAHRVIDHCHAVLAAALAAKDEVKNEKNQTLDR